jgi:cytosine/adenosine deaminase-related metal-dependent hydrolase
MAAAKAGSTFVIDHHASPGCIDGSLDIIAEAFDTVGVGHLLCYEISDRDGKDKALQGLVETERYLSKRQGLVGLHASFTVGDATLERAVDIIKRFKTGVHVHVAEDMYDQAHCQKTYDKRVMRRWYDAGLLDSGKTILVHGLHLDESERALFRSSPCWLAQNMESNLKNKVGYFNGLGLGERIMLGTDGMHSDMLQSARTAYFAGCMHETIDYAGMYKRFRNVHNYIIGNGFTGNADNNLVVLDYDNPTAMNEKNFAGHFIFGLNSNHVQHVIARGKLIVKDKQLVNIDQQEVLFVSRALSLQLWDKMIR